MLPAPDAPGPRWWLVGLLVLWAGLLFGGFAFGSAGKPDQRRMPAWTRLASSLVLVLAGWSWAWFARSSPAGRYGLLIAVGMTLGFLGDLFLAQWLPLKEPVLGGIGAFGLGHIAYVAALLTFGMYHGSAAPGARWGAWAVWLVIGLAGWSVVVWPSARPASLRWAALPYTLLLASTAGLAAGLAVQAAAFLPLAVGAGLFFASDMILAVELFTPYRFPLMGDAVWLTYGPGQMLIVYSVAAAMSVGKTG